MVQLPYQNQTTVRGDARIDESACGRAILPCDLATAREYGRLKAQLRAKGRPLPENDLWIDATARLHGLALVTRDDHSGEVEALAVEAQCGGPACWA